MKNKKLMSLILILAMLSSTVGGGWGSVSPVPNGVQVNIARTMFAPMWSYLILKPFVVRYGLVLLPMRLWVRGEGSSFARNFDIVILYNPPSNGILPFLSALLKILTPIYSLLIVSVGFYLLFLSSSPMGRAKAKSMLAKLIITMVIISVSPQIIDAVFGLSSDLTNSIFHLAGKHNIHSILSEGIFSMYVLTSWLVPADVEIGVIPYIMLYMFAWMPYLIISLRTIILTALMLALPAGILLYFIPALKSIGKSILEQFLIWTFMQAFMALALVSVVKAFSVTTLVSNPTISCVNIPILSQIPFVKDAIDLLFGEMLGAGSTDLMTLGFGTVAYVVVVVSPIIMVMLFRKFLP